MIKFTNDNYIICNVKYVLIYSDGMYDDLSIWLYLCKITYVSEIFRLYLAFFWTANLLEAGSGMLKINYERTFVAKSYFSHDIVYIRPTHCASLVLQQCCAHSLI